ncbi:sensor histidine kinase KdpD [Spirosoma sp. 209]|uniref:sensor histidine kinase n=1 Tax=Spirosoma sp. 209 TaxID=1955701 RepID=UPI00098D1F73|nr:HAMP domain-containing sensor histidine kinase [Spirosoma sp. 209]
MFTSSCLSDHLGPLALTNPAEQGFPIDVLANAAHAFSTGVACTLFLLFLFYSFLYRHDLLYQWFNVASTASVGFFTLSWYQLLRPDLFDQELYAVLLVVFEKMMIIGLAGTVYYLLNRSKIRRLKRLTAIGIVGTLVGLLAVWTKQQWLSSLCKGISSVILVDSFVMAFLAGRNQRDYSGYLVALALLGASMGSTLVVLKLSQQPSFTIFAPLPLSLMLANRFGGFFVLLFLLARHNYHTGRLLHLAQGELVTLSDEKRAILEQQNAWLEQQVAKRTTELNQSNQVKDRLFSIISHELRSPIASLKSMLMMMQQQNLSRVQFMALQARLSQHVDRLYGNLDNLLYWSLGQMNELRSRPAPHPIREVVNEVLGLLQEMAASKQVAFQVNVPIQNQVWADELQLRVILRNLVDNAIKFSKPSGIVTLSSYREGERCWICVQDTGQGMSMGQLATMFANAPSSTGTAGERGTGLGLRLSKELTERNQGQMIVYSEPGAGTLVKINLPAAQSLQNRTNRAGNEHTRQTPQVQVT